MTRKTAEAPPGLKNCVSVKCPAKNPQPLSAFHRNKSEPSGYHKYCKVCRKAQAAAYVDHKQAYDAQRYSNDSEAIIERVLQYYRENAEVVKARVRAYQSVPERVPALREAANQRRRTPRGRERGRQDAHVRRARLRSGEVEKFSDLEIFERDGWICQLCLGPVDSSLPWPHRLSKSLDHIVPVVLGGGHTRLNTQLAHLSCNIRKGLKIQADFREEVVPHGSYDDGRRSFAAELVEAQIAR